MTGFVKNLLPPSGSHNSKREFYLPIQVSSYESPNVVAGRMLVPGLALGDGIDEKEREWGRDSPLFAVRVLGKFPSEAYNAVIGLALVERAVETWRCFEEGPDEFGLGGWPDDMEVGRLHIGVDVARFGDDDAVIQPRRGIRAYRPIVIHGMGTRQVAGKLVEVVREMRGMNELPVVNVDVIGWGAGVVDALAERNDLEVHAINVAEHAVARDEYANLRTEMWFQIRNWLRAGGAIPADGTLEGELVAPTYDFDGSARQRVERKENIKKRLHRSPARADALGLSIIRVSDRDETSIGSPLAAADLGY